MNHMGGMLDHSGKEAPTMKFSNPELTNLVKKQCSKGITNSFGTTIDNVTGEEFDWHVFY